jgi:hypothetical protein
MKTQRLVDAALGVKRAPLPKCRWCGRTLRILYGPARGYRGRGNFCGPHHAAEWAELVIKGNYPVTTRFNP